jgi:UDP-glucose 4-epimerase
MRFLITGGAGSVGSSLTASLLARGYDVRVLDKLIDPLKALQHPKLELVVGGIEEQEIVTSVMRDVDIVAHLAWSFSENPQEIFESDIKGHLNLLEAALGCGVKHFIYTSTAVVYGVPESIPINEKHPCDIRKARKPLYAIAKLTAENLCLMYNNERNLPNTILRFWWAYGENIGGRHLRELIRTAMEGKTIQVPEKAGGSFLYLDDFVHQFELTALNQKTYGEILNVATVYVTWQEIAEMIVELVGSGKVVVVPQKEWTGSAFIANSWHLDTTKAQQILGYTSVYDEDKAKKLLREAIKWSVEQLRT